MNETENSPTIPIVGGTGALGTGLAFRWAGGGAKVILGSRDPDRAAEVAAEVAGKAGGEVAGMSNADAVATGEIVFLTVPFANQSETMAAIRDSLEPGQIVVDCTVPLATAIGGIPTRTVGVWQGSAAQQAQEMAPEGVTVVSALHTISAQGLADPDWIPDEDVLVCGDRKADKARVAELIARIDGLRPVNAGRLETSRFVEQLTAMLISINIRYKAHSGIRITGLPEGDPFS
ncbi:MAG: NADPH-dependent F420 reductase [Solirubrobacterales bacterium]